MIQQLVKNIFLKLGYEIKRYNVAQNQTKRLLKILQKEKINLIFDIGANAGQFGEEMRKNGYKERIVSFEPLELAHKKLVQKAKKYSNWIVEDRKAIGEREAELEIHIAGNSASSSILEMQESHISAAPNTKTIGTEKIKLTRLDSLSAKYIDQTSNLFIKIDTQGYEYNVLIGAADTLKKTKVLQLELSLTELYKGQKLLPELIDMMISLGFELWGLEPAFVDSRTGRMLQVDAIFLNKLM